MKVLILAGWLGGGGAERVVVHLVRGRQLVGHDIELGLLRRGGAYIGQLRDFDGLHFRSWGERLFPSDGSNSSFYRPDRLVRAFATGPLVYRSIIKASRPEVVVSVGRGPNYIAHLAMAGMGAERPAWIVRDGNNLTANTMAETSAGFGRRIGVKLLRRTYEAADCLLVNSHGLAENFHSVLGLDRGRIRVVPNPIDLERLRRLSEQPLAAEMAEPFIFTAGRLIEQKGHDLLLRSFKSSSFRDSHRVVIAGEGDREPALRALAAELGISDRVDFVGFQSNPWAWMSRCALFALPSRWEGNPNALGEAMACGAPSLAADCRFGPSELIRHGTDGWLVAADDVPALTAAIDRLLADDQLRSKLGAAARTRMQDYSLDSTLPKYGVLFAEVAERRRSELKAAGNADGGACAEAAE